MDDDNDIRNSPRKPPGNRSLITAVVAITAALVVASVALNMFGGGDVREVSYNEIAELVAAGTVTEATIDSERSVVRLTTPGGDVVGGWPADGIDDLVKRLAESDATVEVTPLPSGGGIPFFTIFFIGVIAYFLWSLNKRMTPSGSSERSSGPASVPETRFSDVIGCDEVVDELREVTRFLTSPEDFTRLGARVPKGFLLVGPPGTGKTLLARATAGEAGVPFYAISASDFVELYVGMGASRVRKLFAKARKHDKAIVFIDELDSIGKSRGRPNGIGSNDERESTLNALLVEMDGFHGSNVIVLGATNRADVLDAALRRPGRFDRTILVAPPDRRGRAELLRHYLEGKNAADVDVETWAKRTPGMTGAEIEAVCNDAALEAVRRNLEAIDDGCMEAAVSTSYMGRERRSALVSEEDRQVVALHEAGHAAAALAIENIPDPVGASVVPRGGAGGVTWLDGSDSHLIDEGVAQSQLQVMLAGRAAERLIRGTVTQGASDDIRRATALARAMVREWGMGPVVANLEGADGASGDAAVAAEHALLAQAADAVAELLATNTALLLRVRDALLEQETLGPEDLAALRGEEAPPGQLPGAA